MKITNAIVRPALGLICFLGLATAQAASVNVGASTLNGNSIVNENLSGPGELRFDPTWVNNLPIIVNVVTEAGDFTNGGQLDWNGYFINNTGGQIWQEFRVNSGAADIVFIGDVTPDFAPSSSTNQIDGQTVDIFFGAPGESSAFELGDALSGLGDINWVLDISGIVPGQSFDLTLTPTAVPVPAAVWLFGSALGLLGWVRRRQV